ncbi:MAG: DUF3455 domain-containing protein [Herminiimonas sp.]|nr:DUF3455 domain-containing protein [Herminiimonas sp.]
MKKLTTVAPVLALTALLGACSTMGTTASAPMAAPQVPAVVTVPAGNKVAMTAVGMGDLTYECRAKADTAGAFEWVFVGPNAMLYDMNKNAVGKYYGGPTWESMDGSKVTGKQLAVSPGDAGAIPLQLVQANPAMGTGAMAGVTYIQRVKTVGGVAPADACTAASVGTKKLVKYQADYVFYKAS